MKKIVSVTATLLVAVAVGFTVGELHSNAHYSTRPAGWNAVGGHHLEHCGVVGNCWDFCGREDCPWIITDTSGPVSTAADQTAPVETPAEAPVETPPAAEEAVPETPVSAPEEPAADQTAPVEAPAVEETAAPPVEEAAPPAPQQPAAPSYESYPQEDYSYTPQYPNNYDCYPDYSNCQYPDNYGNGHHSGGHHGGRGHH